MGLSGIRPIGLLRLIGRDRAFGCSHKLFPEKVWAVRLSYPPPRQAGQGVAADPIDASDQYSGLILLWLPAQSPRQRPHATYIREEQRDQREQLASLFFVFTS